MKLTRKTPTQVLSARGSAVAEDALRDAAAIMADIARGGWDAATAHGVRLRDITQPQDAIVSKAALEHALHTLDPVSRGVLERTADRIGAFARAQRDCLRSLDIALPSGRGGHTIRPVDAAGCYAPGGRFPLPSTVLMTAVTARAAGVPKVIIASPKPTQHTLAAAAIAGCDVFLALGGAQAIGVLTFGAPEVEVPPCGLIAGPGNKWVTAAKYLATRYTCIDMLAGPSEVLIIADATADAGVVAADMLAQAEHDTDASAVLVTTSPALADAVEAQLDLQLADLPTHATARAALECNSYIVVVNSVDEAITISDSIAPEHLEVLTAHPRSIAERLRHYGAVFIGTASGEVLGDYGAGPNHVLPTGGLGRSIGGLSVLNFLKVQTFLECNNNSAHTELVGDAAAMGRIEGLEAHARAAERRRVARSS